MSLVDKYRIVVHPMVAEYFEVFCQNLVHNHIYVIELCNGERVTGIPTCTDRDEMFDPEVTFLMRGHEVTVFYRIPFNAVKKVRLVQVMEI